MKWQQNKFIPLIWPGFLVYPYPSFLGGCVCKFFVVLGQYDGPTVTVVKEKVIKSKQLLYKIYGIFC